MARHNIKAFTSRLLIIISTLIFSHGINSCKAPEEPEVAKTIQENSDSSSNNGDTSGDDGTSHGQANIVLGDNLSKGFMLDLTNSFGSTVMCNGKSAKEFIPRVGEKVSCLYNTLTLATYSTVQLKSPDKGLQLSDADEFIDKTNDLQNAISLITSLAVIKEQTVQFNLTESEEMNFVNYYKNDLGIDPFEFAKLVEEAESDTKTNKAPSTHVTKIEEVTTEGASTSFKSDFISVNAEDSLQYTPSTVVISTAVLTDNLSRTVEGIEYYSSSSRGKTNDKGEFKFVWGQEIVFGIDTFELGKVRGNQKVFLLTDLNDGHVGRNIERLIQRFGKLTSSHIIIPEIVRQTFAQYPNVINEIIKLSLSEDTTLNIGSGEQTLTGEFNQQFNEGESKVIDQIISASNSSSRSSGSERRIFRSSTKASADDSGQILVEINKLWGITDGWGAVSRFHVFHDSISLRGSYTGQHKGNARAQAVVYVSNNAFPVMMARNDINYWIPFGEKAAYDELGLAFITEPPSTVIPDNVFWSSSARLLITSATVWFASSCVTV